MAANRDLSLEGLCLTSNLPRVPSRLSRCRSSIREGLRTESSVVFESRNVSGGFVLVGDVLRLTENGLMVAKIKHIDV